MDPILALIKSFRKHRDVQDKNCALTNLLQNHQSVISSLRRFIDPAGIQEDKGRLDFLTGLVKQHETIEGSLKKYIG